MPKRISFPVDGLLAEHHRLIAIDLPGHGESGDAPDSARTYTRAGLAEAIIELLGKLEITQAVVVGWSLGGHIGIELMPRFVGMRGLMAIGTPPVANGHMSDGFQPSAHTSLQPMSEAGVESYVDAIFGCSAEPFLRNAVARTDPCFRRTLFEAARAGLGVDQRQVVETSMVPLAIVNGGDDGVIKLDYLDKVAYANLWERRTHRLPGLGHAPFWQNPSHFNPVLERFLQDLDHGRA